MQLTSTAIQAFDTIRDAKTCIAGECWGSGPFSAVPPAFLGAPNRLTAYASAEPKAVFRRFRATTRPARITEMHKLFCLTLATVLATSPPGWAGTCNAQLSSGSQQAAGEQGAPGSLILLLKNGSIVEGEITPTAEGFRIRTRAGSQYLLESKLVRGTFRNMREIFEQKKADALSINDPRQALHELFHWSIQTHRLEFAEEVVRLLERTVQDQSLLDRYQTQLASARARDRSGSQTHAPSKNQALATRPLAENQARTDDQTKPQAWASTAEPAAQAGSSAAADDRYLQYKNNPWALNRTAERLPSGAYHAFRKMQNELVTSCTASHCHDSTTSTYFLKSPAAGQDFSKHFTTVNLVETLRHIDHNQPDASPLLKRMLEAHGGQTEPGFSEESEFYYQLRYWSFYVVGLEKLWYEEQYAKHLEANPPQSVLPQTSGPNLTDEEDLQQALSGTLGNLDNDALPDRFDPTELDLPSPQELLPSKPQQPADPFDPKPFNEQAIRSRSSSNNR